MPPMDVWFCAKQEPRREAQSLADDAAKIQTRAPNARTDIPAPLDRDLSWRSAHRRSSLLNAPSSPPPKTIAPRRPLPMGSASIHWVAGFSYQRVRSLEAGVRSRLLLAALGVRDLRGGRLLFRETGGG